MDRLIGHSITDRIAVVPQAGRKVFTLQTLPASEEPLDDPVGQVFAVYRRRRQGPATPEAMSWSGTGSSGRESGLIAC
jgi:hypothetical protein